jgi:hypothetical protein
VLVEILKLAVWLRKNPVVKLVLLSKDVTYALSQVAWEVELEAVLHLLWQK